jgi:Asp-tRNA(Asn)/Glu-tRNA(Gln) amidotransferase A subunit family amidase
MTTVTREGTGDINDMSATELARLVRRGEVSPVALVESSLERIAGDRTNAVVTIVEDALDRARGAERALTRGESLGPLHGLPFTAKDVLDTAGTRATAGSRLLEFHVPATDAPAVAAMRAAGAILVGKTNCPEFALEPQTANPLFGETRHPLDPRLGPGGSSGGCAAAVAGRLTPLSLGTDYGGSVRFPAHCTGIVGLRPTPGAVPAGGQCPAPPPRSPRERFSLVGPLARTVDDVALVLGAFAAPVPRSGDPRAEAGGPRRCAWALGEGTVTVRADLVAVVEEAAALLAAAGYEVVEAAPPGFEHAQPLFGALRATDDYADLAHIARGHRDELTPRIRGLLDGVTPVDAAAVAALDESVRALRAGVLDFLEHHRVLLLPVAAVPAFPSGSTELDVDGVHHVVNDMTILAPCRAVSLLGLPALSVPAGVSRDGLPVGVQVVGRPGREDEVLEVGRTLERATGG